MTRAVAVVSAPILMTLLVAALHLIEDLFEDLLHKLVLMLAVLCDQC